MTSGSWPFVIAFTTGLGLGVFYFGGLWLTVRRLCTARRPALLTMGSLTGRMGIILLGFYLVMDGHWERLLVCLSGFVLIRSILVQYWRPHKPCFRREGEKQ